MNSRGFDHLQTSKVIEVDGVFIGAAMKLSESAGWRFVSADERASQADGVVALTLQDTQMIARRAFLNSRLRPLCAASATA